MDKLRTLLSAGAMLSLVAGTANAGRLMDLTGPTTTPTGVGMATTVGGFQEVGSPYTGAQGLEPESAVPWSLPTPGTINMRVNSFVNEFPMATWWTGMNGNGTGSPGNKQQSYGIYGWIRIDLGLDGMTKNGIRYGAYTQIRENNTTSIGGGFLPGGAAGSNAPSSTFAQGASPASGDNTLYVRHAFTYIGTDHLGFVRIGSVVNAMTLYEMGLYDDMDVGGWISFGTGGANAPAGATPIWPWADNGGAYMAAGIAYLSPVIDGFDLGVSFEPNNSPPFDGSGCSSLYNGCATQSSSTSIADASNRYRNMLNVALRYRNTFGPVGVAMSGIYTTSGVVNAGPGIPATSRWKPIKLGDVGAEVVLNHSLSVGGNVMWGDINNNWGLRPECSATVASCASAVAWTVGAKYTFLAAPLTVGISYFNYKYQGVTGPTVTTQRTSQGIDTAAVYGLGPGVSVLAEYAWGQVHQGGIDVLTGGPSTSFNTSTAQVITAGMSVRF